MFWPDLASVHYAKDVQAELQRLKIEFVPKLQNPPNVPQLRILSKGSLRPILAIEHFLAYKTFFFFALIF